MEQPRKEAKQYVIATHTFTVYRLPAYGFLLYTGHGVGRIWLPIYLLRIFYLVRLLRFLTTVICAEILHILMIALPGCWTVSMELLLP